MTKKQTTNIKKRNSTFITVLVALAVLLIGYATFRVVLMSNNDKNGAKHVIPYVDGDVAAERVADFYFQLITNPSNKQSARQQLLSFYGTKNLLFYDEYYQHGFDALTCSNILPVKVTTSLISTGPVANINAIMQFADNSSSSVNVTAVLNAEGLKIDTVTCPGEKGNLPPVSAQ